MPKPFYSRGGITIYCGDNREILADMDPQSISAVVCDPPYGLSREPDVAEVLKHWLAGDDYHHSGGGFMGKTWDSFVPGPSTWKMVAATMKPGAHLLSFAGTRTYDLMGMSIRLAGFNYRETLSWIFGSGFPKSHDVSKAIDKMAGAEREVIGSKITGNAKQRSNGTGEFGQWAASNTSGQQIVDITAPATPAAEQWQGFGTALKPAYEPIIMARAPFKGTVAANVLAHGTGAINIDACRIGTEQTTTRISGGKGFGANFRDDNWQPPTESENRSNPPGRWPANVILDEAAAEALDAQSGVSKSIRSARGGVSGNKVYGEFADAAGYECGYGDTGGASRFFYVAKASRRERNAGLEGMPERESTPHNFMAGTKWIRDARHPDGGYPSVPSPPKANSHPTVKPLALMRYLIQMVTPPGGIVLDPFAGSGSTLVAAAELGFNAIGIEMNEAYAEIAARRVDHAIESREPQLTLEGVA